MKGLLTRTSFVSSKDELKKTNSTPVAAAPSVPSLVISSMPSCMILLIARGPSSVILLSSALPLKICPALSF